MTKEEIEQLTIAVGAFSCGFVCAVIVMLAIVGK